VAELVLTSDRHYLACVYIFIYIYIYTCMCVSCDGTTPVWLTRENQIHAIMCRHSLTLYKTQHRPSNILGGLEDVLINLISLVHIFIFSMWGRAILINV
jgi:hypothetical protein